MRAWTRELDYPRDRYEVLLAAPDDFPRDDLAQLQALLSTEDRVITSPERHDMPLVAAAAKVAAGAVLFFTESHCRPEPDILSVCAGALAAHPDWSGFSCRSLRITENPLAKVEGDMYEADIATGMAPGHWRKVLDQAFVVRREPYFETGGFDPTLGHFAEWMLAARFWRQGLVLGYVPEAKLHHHYVGDLDEWIEFTSDFVRGEMTSWARGEAGEFADLFGSVDEWTLREDWRPATGRHLLRVALADAVRRADVGDVAVAIRRWLPAALNGIALSRLRAAVSWRLAKARTLRQVRTGQPERLRATVMAAMSVLTRLTRLDAVAAWHAAGPIHPAETPRESGSWEPVADAPLRGAGFHLLHVYERAAGEPLIWSEPAAMIHLLLETGTYDVDIDWLNVRPPSHPPEPRFYLNERLVTPSRIGPVSATLRVSVSVSGTARLSWGCGSFSAPHDPRRLGLPIRRISWRRV